MKAEQLRDELVALQSEATTPPTLRRQTDLVIAIMTATGARAETILDQAIEAAPERGPVVSDVR